MGRSFHSGFFEMAARIRVLATLQGAEKEFTELTGIKVSSEQIPEQQQRQPHRQLRAGVHRAREQCDESRRPQPGAQRDGLPVTDPWAHLYFAPHAPYSVADATLQRLRRMADQLDAPVAMHLHETAADVEAMVRAAQAVLAAGRPVVRSRTWVLSLPGMEIGLSNKR